jgi:hypothetical protein
MHAMLVSTSSGVASLLASANPHNLAYLDPGSGSLLLQLVLAALLGAAVLVRAFWSKIKAFFARLFGRGGKEPEDVR